MIYFRNWQLFISMAMEADSSQAWTLLTDTSRWTHWGPSIRRVEASERYLQSSSTGRVQTSLGIWLPYTVTDYRQGKYWSWRLGNIEATGHEVTPSSKGRCLITFSMPWWSLPYTLICHIALRRLRKLLAEHE
jgi:hypothetical protein